MKAGAPEEGQGSSEFDREVSGLWRACFVAVLGGVLIGVIGASFRASLDWLVVHYLALITGAQGWSWLGWVVPVGLGAIGAGLARWLVRPQPLAAGSGVQHVEAIMRGQAEPASILVVPIKFVGGLLAMGVGLALGREGPTIQMGATIGAELARRFACAKEVMRDLQAALGGAGLAVAFNAPVGGALFVFEEVAHAFRLRLTIVTLLGTATAIAVARMILGGTPDFEVAPLGEETPWTLVIYAVFGGLMGVLGVFYNRTTLFFINTMDRFKQWPMEVRAALVGGLVGVVAWFAPDLVGDGDPLSQQILVGTMPLALVVVVLVIRWFLGPLSYSAGTPGGLFSPLLLVGAALGALFVMSFNAMAPPEFALSVVAFGVVGMAAFFTGIVRAPLTGIILIAEMTATSTLMIPMMVAAFAAMLSASLLKGEPIYDTLRTRMLATLRQP
ncbi:MAG: ClC family H(+)/Cl(-) exchange transporter [Terrimicrobiaceae bacterium]